MLLASANTAHQCAQHWRSCPASSPVSRRHRRIIIARSRGGGNPLGGSGVCVCVGGFVCTSVL